MQTFVIIACLVIAPAIIVSGETGPVTEPIPLLIWAAGDPSEDSTVKGVDAAKFFDFLDVHREEFLVYYNKLDIIGAISFLNGYGEESGTEGVSWPAVFAKIMLKKVMNKTEEKEHGLPSLVIWAMRNTGPGTANENVSRTTLVRFILDNKTAILKLLSNGDVDGLVTYLSESASKDLDWNTIIADLKDNRQLFKYSCGILDLQLCDRLN